MSSQTNAEKNLREGLKAQSSASFEDLLEAYEQSVFILCSMLTRSEKECEDAVCAVLRKIIAESPKLSDDFNLRLWVLRAAVDCSLAQDETIIEELDMPIEALKVSVVDNNADHQQGLRYSVRMLPAEYRVVLVLREVLRLHIEEIAMLMTIPETEVRTYLHRARMMVSRQMRKDGTPEMKAVVVEAPNVVEIADAKFLN